MHSRSFWLIALAALLLLAPGAMAFSVSSLRVSPDTINPGDPVNVSCTIYAASGTAFSTYDDLQLVTALDDPVWSYTIIVNDIENVRPAERSKILTIGGYELSYPSQDEVVVRVALQAHVPQSAATGADISVLKAQELDARSSVITTTVANYNYLVGQPTPTPTPAYGSITVTSVPAGANVYLDNTIRGITPMSLDAVSNGRHAILLRLDGYTDYSEEVVVLADARQVSTTLSGKIATTVSTAEATSGAAATGTGAAITPTTQPARQADTGSLSVTTSPSGALVYIDGKMKGITPATIPGLAPGTHTIKLILDKYQDLETTTDITAGTTSEFVTGLSKRQQLPGFGSVLALAAVGLLLVIRQQKGRKQ